MQSKEINAYLETICQIIVSEQKAPSSLDWESVSTDITNKQYALCSCLWDNFLYGHSDNQPHIQAIGEVDYMGLMQRRGRPSGSTGAGLGLLGGSPCQNKQGTEIPHTVRIPSSKTVIGRLKRLITQIEELQGGIDTDIVNMLQDAKDDNIIYCSQTLINTLCQLESTINFIENLNKRASYYEEKVSAIMDIDSGVYHTLPPKIAKTDKVRKIKKVIQASYKEYQLRLIFRNLKQCEYIGQESVEDDFVYYFSGIGQEPKNPIRWCGTELKYFIIFISEMVPKTMSIPWSTVKNIFSGINNPTILKQNWQGQLRSARYEKNKSKVRHEIFLNA